MSYVPQNTVVPLLGLPLMRVHSFKLPADVIGSGVTGLGVEMGTEFTGCEVIVFVGDEEMRLGVEVVERNWSSVIVGC